MELSYRSYQKVLNISLKPKATTTSCCKKSTNTSTRKVTKPKRDESQIKRRTKTGCLTCRKRKKKCDEDKVNGKCQGCTRNFLDCCWPDPTSIKPKSTKKQIQIKPQPQPQPQPQPEQFEPLSPPREVTSPIIRPRKCDINYILLPEQKKPEEVATTEPKVFIPYPSPTLSPVFSEAKPSSEVSHFALPPMYNVNYRLQSKDSNVRSL